MRARRARAVAVTLSLAGLCGVPATMASATSEPEDARISAPSSAADFLVYDDMTGTSAEGIWIIGADGSSPRRLLRHPDDAYVSGPTVSPDGTRFAFRHTEQTTRLTDTRRHEQEPEWSSDGRWISFVAPGDRACLLDGSFPIKLHDINRMRSRGGRAVLVPTAPDIDWNELEDSHGDLLLARAVTYGGASGDPADPCPPAAGPTSYVLEADGTGLNGLEGYAMAFSPDGTRYAYAVSGAVLDDLWTARLNGSGARFVRAGVGEADWAQTG